MIEKGGYLFVEGDSLKYVYIIDEGDVSLIKLNNTDKVELLHQGDGEIVGADLYFTGKECKYSAIANKTTNFYKILLSDFENLIQTQKELSIELIQYLCQLLDRMESNMSN